MPTASSLSSCSLYCVCDVLEGCDQKRSYLRRSYLPRVKILIFTDIGVEIACVCIGLEWRINQQNGGLWTGDHKMLLHVSIIHFFSNIRILSVQRYQFGISFVPLIVLHSNKAHMCSLASSPKYLCPHVLLDEAQRQKDCSLISFRNKYLAQAV